MAKTHPEPVKGEKSAVMIVGLDGTITQADSSALELLGRSEEQMLGSAYGGFLTIAHIGAGAEEILDDDPVAASLSAEAPYGILGILRGADRLLRPMEGYVAPTHGKGHKVDGAVLKLEVDAMGIGCNTRAANTVFAGKVKHHAVRKPTPYLGGRRSRPYSF